MPAAHPEGKCGQRIAFLLRRIIKDAAGERSEPAATPRSAGSSKRWLGRQREVVLPQVDRTKVKGLLRRSIYFSAGKDRGFIAFMAVRVESSGPALVAGKVA